MFSSFFSAIQNFVLELVKSNAEGLRHLDIGQYLVHVSNVNALDLELVSVAKPEEKKEREYLLKLHDRIIRILMDNKEMFNWDNWSGNLDHFAFLDLPIVQLFKEIREKEKITFIPQDLETESLQQLSLFQEAQKQSYREELDLLKEKIKKTSILSEKKEIILAMQGLGQKIQSPEIVQTAETELKKIEKELLDTKGKAQFFLKQTKDNISKIALHSSSRPLSDLEIREVYLPLYSFSSKLRLLGKTHKADELKELASGLMDKERSMGHDLGNRIRTIFALPDDIDVYLK
jgi:hypothetical protein